MNEHRLDSNVIFTPYIMHQMNAGKQDKDSGIAIPSHGTMRTVEQIANIAKRAASIPMFRSNRSCFIVSPMNRSDIVSNAKKAIETIK